MEYTHFDQNGNAVMVDVSDKIETKRTSVARGSIRMSRECYEKKRRCFGSCPYCRNYGGKENIRIDSVMSYFKSYFSNSGFYYAGRKLQRNGSM